VLRDITAAYIGAFGIEDVIETTKNACAAGALLAGTSTFPSLTKIKEISKLVEINPLLTLFHKIVKIYYNKIYGCCI
jgi:hypothetical protein